MAAATALVPLVASGWLPFLAARPAAAATLPISQRVLPTALAGLVRASESPLTASQFASYSPDPTRVAHRFDRATRTGALQAYRRAWADPTLDRGVTDLVAGFPSVAAAAAYRDGQQEALATAAGVQTARLPGIPGARDYTYPITAPVSGTEEVVVVTAGPWVATVTFTSATGAASGPISSTEAAATASAQYRLLAGVSPVPPVPGTSTATVVGWVLLGVAGLLAVVLLVALALRRTRRPGRATRLT
ncbi:MAG TPA: hypothetical protein VHW47_05620 [Acidimicrobiales bacterium]|nr:hypothetical protein [Acidimicrobiales bacterium]